MVGAAVIGIALVAVFQDPLFIKKPAKMKNVQLIVEYADKNNQDPYELLAIAITESNLNPKAISSKGAVGLFQVMCKYWYKQSGYKSIAQCNKKLLNPKANVKAGVMVLSTVRKKYEQCKGELAYRCYFAGQRWMKYRGKTKRQIIRYENKIKERKEILHNYYEGLIENIRSELKTRS